MHSANTYLPDSHEFANLTHGRCHFRIDGHNNGKNLLLIHGATVPAWEFDRLVPYLTRAGFRTIRADLYGHGYSDRPEEIYNIPLFARQQLDLLDYLGIDKATHVLGHSLGAAIAAYMATRMPHRFAKLLLAAPLVDFSANQPLLKIFRLPLAGELLTSFYVVPMLKRRRTRRYRDIEDGGFVHKFRTQFILSGFEKALLSMFRHGTLGNQCHIYDELNQTKHPTLILRGEEDVLVTTPQIVRLQKHLAKAGYIEIPGTAHAFMLTHPEAVAPKIIKFIDCDM